MNPEIMGNAKRISVMTIISTFLLAATAIQAAPFDNVFASSKNQASTGTNACGNGEASTNVGCQNIDSQIQGHDNSAAITAQQTFPTTERTGRDGDGLGEQPSDCTAVEGTRWSVGGPALGQNVIICLPINGLNIFQEAVWQLGPSASIKQRTTILASEEGTGNCPSRTARAKVLSGPQFPTGVGPDDIVCVSLNPPPPALDPCSKVEGTLWSVTLQQRIDISGSPGVSLGSELCLPLAELNKFQVATVIPGPDGSGPRTLDVNVVASDFSGNCAAGIGYRALVTLGTQLPPGVQTGDIVCVSATLPNS